MVGKRENGRKLHQETRKRVLKTGRKRKERGVQAQLNAETSARRRDEVKGGETVRWLEKLKTSPAASP